MKIGVLDIQGSVEEHFAALKRLSGKVGGYLKIQPVLVKTVKDLEGLSGSIIPGGESTTIGKLLRKFGLREEIIKRTKRGLPIWGTCAGAILLAKKIVGKQTADGLKLMDITVERNAYGRQLDSFETQIEFDIGYTENKDASHFDSSPDVVGVVDAIFIRAPKIVKVGKGVKILAIHEGEIVAARQGNLLATNFHPELTEDLSIHKYFVEMCRN